MRRVAITGLGAVTPLGLVVPATWDAAVSGRSGVGWIEAFDPSDYPVRIAAEVRGFDPGDLVPAKEARRMDRNVLLAVAAAQQAWDDAGVDGEVDRSPTGSGVTARMALDQVRESIPPKVERTFMGPTGEAFRASIDEIIESPAGAEVRVRIEGQAYFTGKSSFIFEDGDPLIDGFLLAQEVGGGE